MMLPSHLLATLLVCGLLSFVRPMPPREWLLALAFGVAIDLDHLLQLPAYVAMHGTDGLRPAAMLHWGAAWQGIMHTPWALALVAAACFLFSSWIPALFWSLHMVQDFVVARHLVPFGSPLEWVIVAFLLAAVVVVALLDHQTHARGVGFAAHVWARIGGVLPFWR